MQIDNEEAENRQKSRRNIYNLLKMKKLLIIFGVVVFSFAFFSCKKQCVCSGTIEANGNVERALDKESVGEMKKSECESYDYPFKSVVPEATVVKKVTCKAE